MSYYLFNRQELLQNSKNRYHNSGEHERAAEYYIANEEVIKEKANNKYKILSEKRSIK